MKQTMMVVTLATAGVAALGFSAQSRAAIGDEESLFAITQALSAAAPRGTSASIAPLIVPQPIRVLASQVHQAACDSGGSAVCAMPAQSGLAYAKTLSAIGFTLHDWKEVLRLIYFGVDNTHFATPPTVAATVAARRCTSPVRFYLAQNFGKLFQNDCTGITSGCVEIKHAFRLDMNSATTDLFRSLLGFENIAGTGGAPFCNQWIPNQGDADPNTGNDHYYNDYDKA